MRLKNIANIEETNKYPLNQYINEHNEKFSISLQGNIILDIHKPLGKYITLYLPSCKSTVYVRKDIDGNVSIFKIKGNSAISILV
jgi:hypothetical protein